MKRGHAILLMLNIVLMAVSAFNAVVHAFNNYTFSLFLFGIFLLTFKYFGIERDNKYYNKDLLFNILIGLFMYTVISYLLGLWLGFLANPLSMNIIKIVYRIFPIIIIISISEVLRYIFLSKSKRYKDIIILTTISFIFLELTMLTSAYDFSKKEEILTFVLLMMTVITKNIFLSYSSYKTDYVIPISYRLYMELPIYMIPLFPDLGDYVNTMIYFLVPIVFLYITYKSLAKEKSEELHFRPKSKIRRNIGIGILVIVVLSFVGITCGWFKYYTLVIGSGSMTPNINKGDIIIIKKLSQEELEELQIGDVLVFESENRIVVHRIEEITDNEFYTKGDANNEKDAYPVKRFDVIGTTNLRLRVLGWPVLWLNELIS